MKGYRGPNLDWKTANINHDLTVAHRLIMEASEGPSEALLRGKASRAKLSSSAAKLRHALQLIESALDA